MKNLLKHGSKIFLATSLIGTVLNFFTHSRERHEEEEEQKKHDHIAAGLTCLSVVLGLGALAFSLFEEDQIKKIEKHI